MDEESSTGAELSFIFPCFGTMSMSSITFVRSKYTVTNEGNFKRQIVKGRSILEKTELHLTIRNRYL